MHWCLHDFMELKCVWVGPLQGQVSSLQKLWCEVTRLLCEISCAVSGEALSPAKRLTSACHVRKCSRCCTEPSLPTASCLAESVYHLDSY